MRKILGRTAVSAAIAAAAIIPLSGVASADSPAETPRHAVSSASHCWWSPYYGYQCYGWDTGLNLGINLGLGVGVGL
ncbi:hypothetical protein [Streptomyces sp. NPDC003077]|uniref:hypothetical protein n=1 Tax=Streptomyces sp. NPDC003077 TaxID=3154443 RepID=UPI0033AB8529